MISTNIRSEGVSNLGVVQRKEKGPGYRVSTKSFCHGCLDVTYYPNGDLQILYLRQMNESTSIGLLGRHVRCDVRYVVRGTGEPLDMRAASMFVNYLDYCVPLFKVSMIFTESSLARSASSYLTVAKEKQSGTS